MKDGRIQQAQTPLLTYNYPANRFVAGFIGMPPMNFFDGAVKLVNGEMVFEEGKLKNKTTLGGEDGSTADPNEPVVAVGELTLPGNGFTVAVPDRLKELLAGKVGSHVVLGIRPEHLHVRKTEWSVPIAVKLNVVEPLGNDMDVYMSTALHDHVVGRIEAEPGLVMGSAATVYADVRKAHFFEPGVTGLNLSLAAGGFSSAGLKEQTHALA